MTLSKILSSFEEQESVWARGILLEIIYKISPKAMIDDDIYREWAQLILGAGDPICSMSQNSIDNKLL